MFVGDPPTTLCSPKQGVVQHCTVDSAFNGDDTEWHSVLIGTPYMHVLEGWVANRDDKVVPSFLDRQHSKEREGDG